MNLPQQPTRPSHRPARARRGATMMIIALLMTVLVAMVAFSVDLAQMYLARNQLHTAVDAGALAATMQLRENPEDLGAAIAAGKDFVGRNRVGAYVTIPAEAITVEAGKWDNDTRTFSPGAANPNAVSVSGNLENQPLFFSRLLGWTEYTVPRAAIAQRGGNPADIILTLDLSGSMAHGGRIEALRDASPRFMDMLLEIGGNDRVGVMGYGAIYSLYDPVELGHAGVPYGSAPTSLYPMDDDWVGVKEADLSFDLSWIRNNVLDNNTLQAGKYNNLTPIGAALRDSTHYLAGDARHGVDRVIILMSDGLANRPEVDAYGYALQMADYAASNDVRVYTISLGDSADETLMDQIAQRTEGEHFVASGSDLGAELTLVFRKITDEMKKIHLVQ